MRIRLFSGVLAAVALAGMVRADSRAEPAAGGAPAWTESDRAMSSIDEEERTTQGELANVGPREDECKRRILVRGRAFYKLVRVGLFPWVEDFRLSSTMPSRWSALGEGSIRIMAEWQKLTERKCRSRASSTISPPVGSARAPARSCRKGARPHRRGRGQQARVRPSFPDVHRRWRLRGHLRRRARAGCSAPRAPATPSEA